MSQVYQVPLQQSGPSNPSMPVASAPTESIHLSTNVLPEGMVIDGDIKCLGNLTVEGEVTGEVECGGHLVVGDQANIAKGFKAASVMICGSVDCRWSVINKDGKS